MNILIIEDDHKMRVGLVELLETEGHKIDSAEMVKLVLTRLKRKIMILC